MSLARSRIMTRQNQPKYSNRSSNLLYVFGVLLMAVHSLPTVGCGTETWAIYANVNNTSMAKKFIAEENGLGSTDALRDTPLLWAARNGHADIVRLMIEKKADLNEVNEATGESALIHAVKENHLEVVDILISHGANLNIKDNTGYSALDWASQQGNMDILKIVMGNPSSDFENSETGNPLVAAVYSGKLVIVKSLLQKGYPVNGPDAYGDTPYMAAVKTGDYQIATFLLGQGADIYVTDELGRTPLLLAAQAGNIDMVKYLIGKGSESNVVAKRGYTPLMFASANGHDEMVEYLLEQHGADPNQLDANQRSAIYLAAVGGQWHLIKILLKHGATIPSNKEHAEAISPYVMAPMYEIAGEFYLENNKKEKALEFYEYGEKIYLNMAKEFSDEYSSRVRDKEIKKYLTDFGKILFVVGMGVAETHNAKVQARQHAQMGALRKSKTMGEYRQRYNSTLPIYEREAKILAEQRSQAYNQLFTFDYSGQNNSEDSESDANYQVRTEKAMKRAEKIKSILQCVRTTEGQNIMPCKALIAQ